MKVLILSDRKDLLSSFTRQLSSREEPFDVVVIEAQGQSSFQALESHIEKSQAEVLVAALMPAIDADVHYLAHCHELLKSLKNVAIQQQLPLLFISNTAVFDGERIAYQESDQVCPATDLGRWYVEQEQFLADYTKHMIIRTGWVYSDGEDNFLASVIEHAAQGDVISINSAGKSCPTSLDDLVRVILAILLQLDLNAENWGVFHYVASDSALGFQFMEAILAQASQYEAAIDPKQLRFEHNIDGAPAFYFAPVILKCNRLLEDFGIHQRPWRSLLHSVVKEYYRAKDNKKGP